MNNACETALLRRLGEAGGWLDATALRQGLPHTELALDDTLADMVMRGDLLFNARALQYRLALGPAARLALGRLLREGRRRTLVGRQAKDGSYLLGLARRQGEQVLCAELALDQPGPQALAALQGVVLAWLETPDGP
jgi:hypothetical protein